MAKIIIGIHGLGNKPNAELLEKWWKQSIEEGLKKKWNVSEKIPFKLIYWADILHPEPENPEISDKDDPLYLSEPYIPSNSGINDRPRVKTLYTKFLKFIEKYLDKIFLKKDMTLNFSRVTNKIIHSYFEDLGVYYSDDCMDQNNPKCIARDSIRRRLAESLKYHINDEILLISHSMGTIIAYDVLISNINDCKVHTLVTIGSPLGIPLIGSRIYAEHKSLKVPSNITNIWFNLSDPEDLIALDHTLKNDFLENENKILIKDTLVHNDYKVSDKRNPHKIYGYLRTPQMAKIIRDFIKIEESVFIIHFNNLKNKVKKLWETEIIRRKK